MECLQSNERPNTSMLVADFTTNLRVTIEVDMIVEDGVTVSITFTGKRQ